MVSNKIQHQTTASFTNKITPKNICSQLSKAILALCILGFMRFSVEEVALGAFTYTSRISPNYATTNVL